MSMLAGAEALFAAALQYLRMAPRWWVQADLNADAEPRESVLFEAAVRPELGWMRWRMGEPAEEDVVVFCRGKVLIRGGMWDDTLHLSASARRAVAERWIRCDAGWFRRQDRDHDPLGMVLKGLTWDADDDLSIAEQDPAVAGVVLVCRPRQSESRWSSEDSPSTYFLGLDPVRFLRRSAAGSNETYGYDDALPAPALPPDEDVLDLEAALALSARRTRQAPVKAPPVVDVRQLDEGGWSVISHDLAQVLGVQDAYAAEEEVAAALAAAGLMESVEFDSEAGMFAAYVLTEADATAVGNIVRGLAKRR